ncbi:MAG: peptidylprolyl isomerase, partial [Gemmatimonadetes bacterium]|nr:peptidylprolyl isomerase [Gemmatimonadota bacterium]
ERELRSLMLQRLAMEVAVEDAGMDEQELREAYARSPEPELVVRHLVVLSERWRTEEHRDSARARAAEALRRARSGERFADVVAEYSDEPGAAERGGLLTPGREGSWVPEFWAAARTLHEGELSDVVETEYGFHVIRLEERRAVPFEEVRRDVLERFVDLPSALSRAQDWVATQAGALMVDTAAVDAWRTSAPDASAADTLVRWPAGDGIGALTAKELDLYVATAGPRPESATRTANQAEAVAVATAAARSQLLADRARRRGLEPSIAQRAAVERRLSQRIAGWAEVFGFEEGMRPRAVKEAALEALGMEGQAAAIARRELAPLSGVLRALVPVSRPEEQTP